MVIYYLLLTLIILLLISFVIFKKDIMAPAFILCATFILSTLFTIYNIDTWSINLQWSTYKIVISGVCIFIIVAFTFNTFFDFIKKKPNKVLNLDSSIDVKYKEIRVQNYKLIFFIVFALLVSLLYVREVMQIAEAYGGGTWTEKMKIYRDNVSYGILDEDESIPVLINQSYQAVTLMGFIFIYIAINNYLVNKKISKLLLITIIVAFASSFLSAGRLDLVRYPVAALTIYYVLWNRQFSWKKHIGFKFIVKALLLMLLIFVAFVLLKGVVGRIDDRDPFYYISYYLGGPIYNLDLFLKNPPPFSNIWGKETFFGINNFLGGILNNSDLRYIVHKEFRFSNGLSTGNVYTLFRSYIYDFGYSGLLILTSTFSAIFAIFYNMVKIKKNNGNFDFSLLVYSYLVFCVYTAFFADYLFASFFSVRFVKILIIFIITKWFFVDKKFSL